MTTRERLEYLREQIDNESISYSEILELQGLADQIDPSDIVLLEWAGVPENANNTDNTLDAAESLANEVLKWARTPGPHGGNPYTLEFVQTAEKIIDTAVRTNTAVQTLATIYYTADVFTPDDSDTNVYGEPCEVGYGESMESGWYNPDWSMWSVSLTKGQVSPDTIESDDNRFEDGWTLDDLIMQDIEARLGAIDSFDGVTAYASDPQQNYMTGVRAMLAAHVEIHETGESV